MIAPSIHSNAIRALILASLLITETTADASLVSGTEITISEDALRKD